MDKNLELDDKVEGYVKENFWNYYVVEVDTENTLTLHVSSGSYSIGIKLILCTVSLLRRL